MAKATVTSTKDFFNENGIFNSSRFSDFKSRKGEDFAPVAPIVAIKNANPDMTWRDAANVWYNENSNADTCSCNCENCTEAQDSYNGGYEAGKAAGYQEGYKAGLKYADELLDQALVSGKLKKIVEALDGMSSEQIQQFQEAAKALGLISDSLFA